MTGRRNPAEPEQVDDDTIRQLTALGVRNADRLRQESTDDATEDATKGSRDSIRIWSINQPALQLFLDCSTQWIRLAGPGGLVFAGLDYGGVEVVMRQNGHDAPDLFRQLQIMEMAALPVLNGGVDG